MVDCTRENLQNFAQFGCEDQCCFVQNFCGDTFEVINFLVFYTCTLNQNIILLVLLVVIASFATFHFLGTTCENYLAPALSVLAEKFRFSEALAGVTFVALANGAPDIVTAIAAGGSENPTGYYTALGSIFGANLFTTTVILAGCIFTSRQLKSEAFGTIRDLVFFIIATVFIVTLGIITQISLESAIGYFSVYLVFLVFVIIAEYKIRAKERKELQQKLVHNESMVSHCVEANFGLNDTISDYILENHYQVSDEQSPQNSDKSPVEPQTFSYKFKWVYVRAKRALRLKYLREKSWKERTVLEKVLFIYEFPLDLLRDLTIPCVDDSRWNRRIAPLTPFFASLVIIWQFELFDDFMDMPWLWAIVVPINVIFGAVIWKISHDHIIPRSLVLVFSLIAFAVCILWVNLMANAFQDILVMIQIVSGLPNAYLGLTLLAWGNSVPDFFVDYSLSKQGYGQMAISGVFAGQLFNLLVGFGGTLIRATLKNGTLNFDLLEGSSITNLNLIIIAFALVSFIIQLIYAWVNKFVFGKKFGKFLLGYYAIFFATVSVYSLIEAIKH